MIYPYILRILILLSFTLLFFACNDDDNRHNLSNPVWGNCLDEEQVLIHYPLTECYGYGNVTYCDTIIHDGVIPMTSELKEWMPYYCAEVGDKIYFENSRGDADFAIVTSKNYWEAYGMYQEPFSCSNEEAKVLHCELRERAQIKLYLNPMGEEITLYLNGPSSVEIPFTIVRSGFSMSIREENVNYLVGVFNINDSGRPNLGGNILHDQLEIHGYRFDNVIELVTTREAPEHKDLFYSKEYGLVGFADKNGNQWVYVR